jgi:hypothetical protein
MSGLLRRIKRSRAADAGETPAEKQVAAPEAAPTPAVPAAGAAERAPEDRAVEAAPVVPADADVPAGLDPVEAAMRPPAGRRGRLRRRLRYLRRARELMLRDLGGLLFEVHRTAGGDVGAHAGVIGAKVERLVSLDAEAHAIEAALGAPRAEAVVFQPGVGGTCDVCGELYGSAARFCSNCGAPTGSVAHEAAETGDAPGRDPAIAHGPTAATPQEDAAALMAPRRDEPSGRDASAARDETAAHEAPTRDERAPWGERSAARDETAAHEAPTRAADGVPERDAGAEEPAADRPRNPFARMTNGRTEEHKPPGLSPGDPLATRESRS